MKIAIASSGLGHVARGIEIWAAETAAALHSEKIDVTLFRAGGKNLKSYERRVFCLSRNSLITKWAVRTLPKCTWRLGWKNTHSLEQFTFWWCLLPQLKHEYFDILHVQDPMIARWCLYCRNKNWLKAKEILAHGTNETPVFLANFPYVQHLAPWHLRNMREQLSELDIVAPESWTAIPNFVDTNRFKPCQSKQSPTTTNLRAKFGIPPDARVLGCVASVDKRVKRLDYLIREFAHSQEDNYTNHDNHLLIVGATSDETKELQNLAIELGRGRIHIHLDINSVLMPEYYRIMDLMLLTTIYEMMPIAVLEALASGLPLITNRHPVLEWMTGPGGATLDMSREGELTDFLAGITPEWIEEKGRLARQHALDNFSKDAVIEQYIEYYKEILATNAE